ncbi:hypothetical protein FACS1894133_4880 [Clostridia bacterium]|nr:hypothetical protein FACS1894133_4880 [Clostridia bacterium]
MEAKRPYKDTLFRHIFNNRDRVIPLYNAISGESYPADTPVELVTTDAPLFSGLYNDLAFLLGDIIVVLVEHQSTLNPNMPLRMLMYYSDILKKVFDNRTIYRETAVGVPVPAFYVLYNGVNECGKSEVLRLSDLYKVRRDTYPLELCVTLLNINHGINDDAVRVCAELYGYAEFIDVIRRFQREGDDLTTAMTRAIRYCIKHGNSLAGYLEANASEVVNMLTNEFDIDDAKQVWKEEWFREGIFVTAKNMLQDGVDFLTVAKYTHLDRDTIQRLADSR